MVMRGFRMFGELFFGVVTSHGCNMRTRFRLIDFAPLKTRGGLQCVAILAVKIGDGIFMTVLGGNADDKCFHSFRRVMRMFVFMLVLVRFMSLAVCLMVVSVVIVPMIVMPVSAIVMMGMVVALLMRVSC